MRRILRTISVPSSTPPNRYRASQLAWWFWCAERSRHIVLNMVPPRAPSISSNEGTELHDQVLFKTLGEREPWENEFMDDLNTVMDPKYGFHRKLGSAEIFDVITGHPDDFQVTLDGEVTLIEHKTTAIKGVPFIERYRLPMAEFQLKIYAWIFEDMFQRYHELEGYTLSRSHAVKYWFVDHKKKEVEFINYYSFSYYPKSVEAEIKYALEAYKNTDLIIPPKGEWKCRQCPQAHKEVCIFWQKRNLQSPST